MTTNDTGLTIPPAVLALPDASGNEKMLLALYATEPQAMNRRALCVLGVSLAGLKKIKARLIAKGLLRCTANSYKVVVAGLNATPEHGGGHFVAKSGDAENAHKVASLQKTASLDEIRESHKDTIDMLLHQPGGAHLSTFLRVTEVTLRRIESDVPDGPVKDAVVADFIARRDAFFVAAYASTNLSPKQQRDADRLIGGATPEQLARLRQNIELAQLTGSKPTLLLKL